MPDAVRERSSLARDTLWLVGGRLVGSIAAIGIPVVLARTLDPADFGAYKQLFLVFATLFGIAQLGMAESLYYFLPRHPEAAGRLIANAVTVLAVTGAVVVALTSVFAAPVADWLNNPALGGLLPLLAVFLAAMLVAVVLEIVLITSGRLRLAALTFAGSDAIRAGLMVAAALISGQVLMILIGAVAFAGIRLAATLGYLVRRFGRDWRLDIGLLVRQSRYTLPFAAAVAVEVAQASYHQYAVAAWFDPTTFAIYAVGCLQIPFVDLLATSAGNVLMVRMGEAVRTGESVIPLWREATDRLALLLVPLAVGLMVVGRDLIVTLFSDTYAAAGPIFVASAAMVLFPVFAVDAVLRTYAATRFLLALNLGRLAVIAMSIGTLVSMFGPIGALFSALLALSVSKLAALWKIGRLIGADVGSLLPWRGLSEIAGAALLAAALALVVRGYIDTPAVAVALTGAAFALTYGIAIGAMRPADARAALGALAQWIRRRAQPPVHVRPGAPSSS